VYRPLHDGWTLRGPRLTAPVPATVPGCVHTDLLAAGLTDDPYLDDNERRLAWIGRATWTYETVFDWTASTAPRVDLVCVGLDTVATVSLNGIEVARTTNMHRSYRFDVRRLPVTGRNRLRVRFDSAYDHASAVRDAVRPLITVDGGTGRVQVYADVERASDVPLVLTASVAGRSASTVLPPGIGPYRPHSTTGTGRPLAGHLLVGGRR
jgi:beta-mannosidase